jgi:adenosyl cobinamide kinase/adenosyl cobinamide phosphate guanylyltransferase
VITLVLGGTRSGKSEYAEALAASLSGAVTYVATGIATDADMAARIAAHQARRPASWSTAEVGTDLPRRLAAIEGVALVDSLGTWVAASRDLTPDRDALLSVLQARTDPTILVSEEVGLGVHAPTESGRVFTDALGDLNRLVASLATTVLLVVAGRALILTPPPPAVVGDAPRTT